MLAQVNTAAVVGIEGRPVLVEVHIGRGLPSTSFVGLPDTTVREAKDRVRAALLSSGLEWPNRRVTINLAPAGVPKLGSAYDLAIAAGILVANGDIDSKTLENAWFFGELGLDGSIRPAPGVLAVAAAARKAGAMLICATADAERAAILGELRLAPADSVTELVAAMANGGVRARRVDTAPVLGTEDQANTMCDLADVRGQSLACRALEVAAAGSLNLLLYGPPGSGKTMLARRAPGLLPPLHDDAAIEVQLIHSLVGGRSHRSDWRTPPFRAPHHSCSVAALVGGGSGIALPGEVSLAHRGVLFLDELSLFAQHTLEALRQPIEDREVVVSRSRVTVRYPSSTLLIAATNPCPCGSFGARPGQGRKGALDCTCADSAIERYRRRITGPLLDRFDLSVHMRRVNPDELVELPVAATSRSAMERVALARRAQSEVLGEGVTVSDIPGSELARRLPLKPEARDLLKRLASTCGFSGRRIHRMQRAAWVLAMLEGRDSPSGCDIEEAGRLWCHPYGDHA